MARRPFVLLPPSEGKEGGGSRTARIGTFDAALDEPRQDVVAALATLLDRGGPGEIERVLRVRGALLERAIEASHAVVDQRVRWLPAWRRYSGVVWSHLDPSTLSRGQRRNIIVPSGLYGVTTAQDVVGDYRLKMNVALAPFGGLATFWRPWVTPVLAQHCAGATVVNLLPGEHASAINMEALNETCKIVVIRFVAEGGVVVAGHEAKAVKGVVARQLSLDGLSVLETFNWRGWRTKRTLRDGRVLAPRARFQEIVIAFEGEGVEVS